MSEQIPFVETDCKITFEGKTFSSGGTFLLPRKFDGLLGGILYRHQDNTIGNWEGSIKIPYTITNTWNSVFRDYHGCPQKNQSIRFTYQGKQFSGIHYNIEWNDVIHVKELKSK